MVIRCETVLYCAARGGAVRTTRTTRGGRWSHLLGAMLCACGGGGDAAGGGGTPITGGTAAPVPTPMATPAMPAPPQAPVPVCGDGDCDVWEMETAATCPADCGTRCMALCASDTDCGPSEMCANLADGRKCWPAMCGQCIGQCEFEPVGCTFTRCTDGTSSKPPSATCTRPCQTAADCGAGEACASLSTGLTCWPADCMSCATSCNFNPATCEKTSCADTDAGASGAGGSSGAGGMAGIGGMGG